MNVLKKAISFLSNPFKGICKAFKYAVYAPRFRSYSWSCRVQSIKWITPSAVSLAPGVYIGPDCRIQGVRKYNDKVFIPHIILGDNVSIQQNLYLTCATSVQIGHDTAIAAFVTITDIDHPYVDPALPIERQDITTSPVKIGADCKIYNGVVILKGTVIGDHCVVGANSVVSGTFPSFSVIVGAPARVVKRYDADSGCWRKTDAKGNFVD